MTHDHELIGSGSASGDGDMRVYLYPWSSSQRWECDSGGIVSDAVIDAAGQLQSYGAIGSYEVQRYEAEDNTYPENSSEMKSDIDYYSTSDGLKDDFRNFIENRGYDALTGVHQLIHGGYTGCNETGGTVAPVGAGAEQHGYMNSAFEADYVAWSPVCSDSGLTENAAIQESVHCFIEKGSWSSDGDNEHALGTVNGYYNGSGFDYLVSPLLTYHWDESYSDGSSCYYDTNAGGHEQNLTDCTKQAVQDTVDNYT